MNNKKHLQVVDFSNPNADKITSGSTKAMTNNKQQTAIDWLVEQLSPSLELQQKHIDKIKKQAKEMEKNQMIDFALECQEMFKHQIEEKYNETYGGNK